MLNKLDQAVTPQRVVVIPKWLPVILSSCTQMLLLFFFCISACLFFIMNHLIHFNQNKISYIKEEEELKIITVISLVSVKARESLHLVAQSFLN